MIYLDTAALVKLVRRELESEALVSWLEQRPATSWVSSALCEVELARAIRRSDPRLLPLVPGLLARLYRVEIDDVVRATAAAFDSPTLRSLDAIHLATARALAPDVTAFVSYDDRLLAEARQLGLHAESPA